MRLAVFLIAALLSAPAFAQQWATRELCDLGAVRIYPQALAPSSLGDLRLSSRGIVNGTGRYWRITSPAGAVSYLSGTLHSNDPLLLSLPERIAQDIGAARVVAVENDFIWSSRTRFQTAMKSDHIWKAEGDKGFENLDLPDRIKHWIRDRFDGLGWGYDGSDILGLATISEYMMGYPCSDFAGGVLPIQDDLIHLLGALGGAPVIGLEDRPAFYHKLSDGRSFRVNDAIIAVHGYYLNPRLARERHATGAALYLSGEIGTMMVWEEMYFANAFADCRGTEWLRLMDEYLLVGRNRNFLERARSELAEGGVFIAVGSFHLPRKTGIVALLRNAGFAVERIALPGEMPS